MISGPSAERLSVHVHRLEGLMELANIDTGIPVLLALQLVMQIIAGR